MPGCVHFHFLFSPSVFVLPQENSGADAERTHGQHTPQPEPPWLEGLVENGEQKTDQQNGSHRHCQCEADDADCLFHFWLLPATVLSHFGYLNVSYYNIYS